MKKIEYVHVETCPNSGWNQDPTLCVCEKYWEIQDLDRIQKYLEKIFKDMDEPTLFHWASIINGKEWEELDEKDFEKDFEKNNEYI